MLVLMFCDLIDLRFFGKLDLLFFEPYDHIFQVEVGIMFDEDALDLLSYLLQILRFGITPDAVIPMHYVNADSFAC